MKKNLLYFFILILGFTCSLLFLIQELNKEESKYLGFAIILASAVVGFAVGLFIKRYSFLDFLRILLPTSGTLIAALWLLSSGYLNIKAENLKREISKFENDTLQLKNEIIKYKKQKDSILSLKVNQVRINDSIKETNTIIIANNKKTTSELQRVNAQLQFSNNKWSPLLKKIAKPIIELKAMDITDTKRITKIKFFDINGKVLTDLDIKVIGLTSSLYAFSKNDESFLINWLSNSEQDIIQGFDSPSLKTLKGITIIKSSLKSKKGQVFEETVRDAKFRKFILLPIVTAKYEITLNDFYLE